MKTSLQLALSQLFVDIFEGERLSGTFMNKVFWLSGILELGGIDIKRSERFFWYRRHVRMRLTVQPYVWNAPSIDQISVCFLIPHLIYIKMQIPICKHLLTRKPHNRHDPLHVYRQPNGDSCAIGQRSYAVCPRSDAPPPRSSQVLR